MSEQNPQPSREDYQLAENEQWVDFVPTVAVPYVKQRNQAELERDGAIEWLYHTEQRLDDALGELGTDSLTGLLNERQFKHDLDAVLLRNEHVGLLYIDLDSFKRVNDTYGHWFGDNMLRFVAQNLRTNIRPTDIASRLHGDEYAVMVPDIRSDEAKNKELTDEERMDAFATRVHANLLKAIQDSGEHRHVLNEGFDISVGWAVYQPGEDAETFLHRADKSMYEDKPKDR